MKLTIAIACLLAVTSVTASKLIKKDDVVHPDDIPYLLDGKGLFNPYKGVVSAEEKK